MRKNLIFLTALLFVLIMSAQYPAYAQTNTPLRRLISPSSSMWLIHIGTWNWPEMD